MKTVLIKNLTAWMLGLSVFLGATTGPVQPAAAEVLLVGDTVQLVVLAPFYNELSWNNYAGYLGYQPVGARGKVIVGPTVDAWTTWVRVDLTLPTKHVIGWVQVSQVAKVTTTSVAPAITSQPSSATVTAPATASFSVSASGTAPLSYQWQKNGVNLSGATSVIYTTPATSTLDSGSTFRVVVTNSAGSITSSAATLMVNAGTVAPSITTPPSNTTVTAPATASFSISASGTAPLSYQWQKNGGNISGATSNSYITPATTTADSGSTYRVVVSNSAGSVTSSAVTLTVNAGAVAPSITSQPSSATVTAPASATFSVSASGTSLSYQWKKNGTVVGTGTTYTTPATSTVDSGSRFVVVVSNTAGSVTSSVATLTVLPGVVAPANVSLTYSGKLRDKVGQNNGARLADGLFDGTFTMTLGAGSGPRTVTQLELRNTAGGTWDTIPSSIYWTLGVGASLDSALSQNGSDAVNFAMAPGGSMTLFATDCCGGMFATGMSFTLTVTFADGSTAAATTTANAAPVAPTITTQPANATVTAPASATFNVSASGTTLSYQWKKNGAVVGTAATYTTPATSTADSGSTFLVVVSNSAGTVTSNTATLTVNAAAVVPTITMQPLTATVTGPATATFSVSAAGTSPLSYQWQKNTVNIIGATGTSYTTPATSTADSGSTFSVVVTNSAGSVTSANATLTVNAAAVAPTITTQPANSTVTAPASATFSVSASGTSLSYQWKKNGAVVGTGATYTTPATSTADSGSTFSVVVTNSAGSITSSAATLTVNAPADTTPPSVPTALNASASSCSQININWGVSTDTGGSGLKGYNVYRNGSLLKQVLAPSASTSDSGLTPATAYSYNVAAIDNAGNQSSQGATSSTNTQPCNLPPVANAGPDKMGMLSTAVSLSGASSFDPDGMISTYAWSFGDTTSGSGVSVSHAYALAGIYAVTLTVTDSKGATASDTAIVTIASGPVNPTLIGFVPDVGAARDVVIDPVTGLAYVASGEFGLAVVDVANPAAPKAIGGTKPPFYGERLAVDGSMAVVTGNNLGLRVVDVSNPADPRTRGALSGTMRGVAVRGQYAYVLQIVPGNPARTDLLVVDLQRPEDPVVVGRITLAGGWAVRVAGGLAYVPADTAGLQIVDVSNPTAPWIVSTLDTPGAARDVAVAGSYAYVADTTSVQIVRVTTASSPALVGTLATSATAVAASGTRLYALGGSQFKVIDVTNAASPVLRSAIGNPDAHAVAGAGTFALLATPSVNAALNKGGLYVVDVAVPTAPVVRANVYGGFDNTGVAASGGRAVATGNSLGLKVVDVSNPLMPRLLGALGGTMKGVAMEGSYAYVLQLIPGNPARMDLLVVDASAVPPTVVGRVGLAWGITVKVLDGVVYVAADTVGLQIVNVNNPRAPWIMATIDTPGSARGVALANGYAYVADDTSVQVINITTPNNPVIVGSLPTTATAIAAAGGRVYVLGSGQFKILDVRNPPAPVLLSATTGFSAQALDVAGSLVFLATPASSHTDPKGGVYVLDVTTASRPTLVEQIAVPGTTRSITASGGFIYAGDSAGIVDVIMISP